MCVCRGTSPVLPGFSKTTPARNRQCLCGLPGYAGLPGLFLNYCAKRNYLENKKIKEIKVFPVDKVCKRSPAARHTPATVTAIVINNSGMEAAHYEERFLLDT
jgi:hypothetical protein